MFIVCKEVQIILECSESSVRNYAISGVIPKGIKRLINKKYNYGDIKRDIKKVNCWDKKTIEDAKDDILKLRTKKRGGRTKKDSIDIDGLWKRSGNLFNSRMK